MSSASLTRPDVAPPGCFPRSRCSTSPSLAVLGGCSTTRKFQVGVLNFAGSLQVCCRTSRLTSFSQRCVHLGFICEAWLRLGRMGGGRSLVSEPPELIKKRHPPRNEVLRRGRKGNPHRSGQQRPAVRGAHQFGEVAPHLLTNSLLVKPMCLGKGTFDILYVARPAPPPA